MVSSALMDSCQSSSDLCRALQSIALPGPMWVVTTYIAASWHTSNSQNKNSEIRLFNVMTTIASATAHEQVYKRGASEPFPATSYSPHAGMAWPPPAHTLGIRTKRGCLHPLFPHLRCPRPSVACAIHARVQKPNRQKKLHIQTRSIP